MPPRRSSRRTRDVVTAVLVCHDGERWLPEVLRSLARQRRPPDRVVAVDTGSVDGSARLLTAALGEAAVVAAGRDTPFGASVALALAHADRSGPADGLAATSPDAAEWIWLLHDDSAPDPDALDQLLRAADADPRAALLGPKVRTWTGRYLAEVGATIDLTGRRDGGVERRELDQGQRDQVRRALAVGSAGALVARDLWTAVGGYDPRLPFFGDDLDFGWRTLRGGREVVVVPTAVVRHAAALSSGRRVLPGGNRFIARRAALYVLLANLPGLLVPLVLARLVLASLLRAVGLLLLRRPRASMDELRALGSLLVRPDVLLVARRTRARSAVVPGRAARRLLAGPGARLRGYREALTLAIAVLPRPRPGQGGRRVLLGYLSRPWLLLPVGLVLVSLVAERGRLGSSLAGGRLLPAPGGASVLWQHYLASFHQLGLGSTVPAPPTLPIVGLLSLPALGKPWVPVAVLLLGCVPLGGLAAYRASRAVTASPLLRCWAAAGWALLPVATGAVAGGRLDAAVSVIAFPLLAGAAVRAGSTDPRAAGWWPAFAAGLGLAVAAAFAPLLFLAVGAVALAAWVAGWRRSGRGRRGGAVIALLVTAFAVLFPWSAYVARHLALLLAGPGLPDLTGPAAAHHLLLFDPGGPGTPPFWLFAPLLLAAALAWLRPGRWAYAAAGLLAIVAGCVGADVLDRVRVTVAAGQSSVWPAVPLCLAAAGALAAALAAADGARARLADLPFGWRQPAAGVLAAVAALVPAAAAGVWLVSGSAGPLGPARGTAAPAYLAAEAQGSGRRVLAVSVPTRGDVGYALLYRGDPAVFGDDAMLLPAPDRGLGPAVAGLVSGTGADVRVRFAGADIGYLVVTGAAAGAVDRLLAGAPGLTRLAGSGDWALSDPPALLSLLDGGASSPLPTAGAPLAAAVPPGGPGRLLVLAEARSAGWRATLGGRRLPAAGGSGWAQAFRLGAAGGRLRVSFDGTRRSVQLWVELALVLLALVLAAPHRNQLAPAEAG